MKITKRERDLLQYAAHVRKYMGWFVTTNREHRLSVVRSLVKKKLLRPIGLVYMQDEDGFSVEPERTSPGYALTRKGMVAKGI